MVRRDRRFWIKAAAIVVAIQTAWAGLSVMAGGRLGVDLQARPCLPWRLYWLSPLASAPTRGDLVLIQTEQMRLATSNPAAKYVRGVPGDQVRIVAGHLIVNDTPVALLAICRNSYRTEYCEDRRYQLAEDEFLVLGTDEYSFDSRYWGPVARRHITGRVRPLI